MTSNKHAENTGCLVCCASWGLFLEKLCGDFPIFLYCAHIFPWIFPKLNEKLTEKCGTNRLKGNLEISKSRTSKSRKFRD